MAGMKKKAIGNMPAVRRATTSTTTPRKPLAKEIKIGKTKAKMVGGIVPVLAKPKKKMF